ncbi:MAG: Tm-1-like ATP-binding domain-containing protein [Deltaproteobacteria bacterium]|nr:Tm-1-like ATP-binding domain-containing protein [Deltaproteobacteria bacterium]
MPKRALIIATLDTKPEEAIYLRNTLARSGVKSLIIDAGALGVPGASADITREQVARKAGHRLDELAASGDKGVVIAAMTAGLCAWVTELHTKGRIQGVIAVGGGQGTAMGTAAMQILPLGFPKVMVTTLAAGNLRPFLESQDIAVFPSLADMLGMNRVLEQTLGNAANALAGMMAHRPIQTPPRTHCLGITAFGVVTRGLMKLRLLLDSPHMELVFFHANGAGGAAMESLARQGRFDALVDWTTHELMDQVAGGIFAAREDRLDILAEQRIPCLVSAGAVDYACMGPHQNMPSNWQKRNFIVHNRNITLVRATAEEMGAAAKLLAAKLNRALGPVKVMIPLGGFSEPNAPGGQFYDPVADTRFIQTLENTLSPTVELIKLPHHINDDAFIEEAARELRSLLRSP